MTKKHFVAIAKGFAATRPADMQSTDFAMWQATLFAVLNNISDSNPAFNRQRFISACYA